MEKKHASRKIIQLKRKQAKPELGFAARPTRDLKRKGKLPAECEARPKGCQTALTDF